MALGSRVVRQSWRALRLMGDMRSGFGGGSFRRRMCGWWVRRVCLSGSCSFVRPRTFLEYKRSHRHLQFLHERVFCGLTWSHRLFGTFHFDELGHADALLSVACEEKQ